MCLKLSWSFSSSSSSSACVCEDATSDRRAGGLHSSRGRLGLGSGGRGLYQHWLLLCLPQVHHSVLQRDRGDLQCHQQPSVMDLIDYACCHVCRRSVQFTTVTSVHPGTVLVYLSVNFTIYLFCKLHINMLSYTPMGYLITMVISVWRSRKKIHLKVGG